MPDPRRIVVCSLEAWDEVWRRNQYLVDSLLREDPDLEILFVEPAVGPLHSARNRQPIRLGRGVSVVSGYEGRLRTLQPTKLLPRRLGSAADFYLTRSVRSAVRRLGWTRPVLWINDPKSLPLLRSTQWPALYDITDDWVLAERDAREHYRLASSDAELLELCREVVVCSPALLHSKGAGRDVTLIRNAVDVARYRRPHERPTDLPREPYALYAGTLHEDRLDVDLVLATAARLDAEGACLVLLGPNALTVQNSDRLTAAPGVVMLGSRSKDSVPAYLQHANVLVVPHIIDDFTDSLDPIKLYEYLAVGRPIVSTAVAGFREESAVPGVVIVSGERFLAAVAAGVESWVPSLTRDDVPDWPDRGRDMGDVIERLTVAPTGTP
jgi:teichuronic acid biosynthesis glycosyltransferase TuaH